MSTPAMTSPSEIQLIESGYEMPLKEWMKARGLVSLKTRRKRMNDQGFILTFERIVEDGRYPSMAACLEGMGRKSYDDNWIKLRRHLLDQHGYDTSRISPGAYRKKSND